MEDSRGGSHPTDETDADSSDDGAESATTADKIVFGASIAGATVGACLLGPVGALVGLRVGGTLAVAGVEKYAESDIENRVKISLHELRYCILISFFLLTLILLTFMIDPHDVVISVVVVIFFFLHLFHFFLGKTR